VNNRVSWPVYALLLLLGCCVLSACNSQPTQHAQSGQCPQDRATEYAPAPVASQSNPLPVNAENLEAGEKLYQKTAKPLACAECHGENGDGNGPMANMFEPAPRNFTCSEVVGGLADGQFFWIIKNGSIGTSMPAFEKLTDEQIWQITIYLRSLEVQDEAIKNSQSGKAKTETKQAAL